MPSLSRPLSWRRWRRRQSIRTIATRQRRRRRPRAASKPNIAAARATSSGAPAARAAAAAAFAAFASAVREITVLVCYTSATLLHYTHSLASFVSIERRSARRLSLARSLPSPSPPPSGPRSLFRWLRTSAKLKSGGREEKIITPHQRTSEQEQENRAVESGFGRLVILLLRKGRADFALISDSRPGSLHRIAANLSSPKSRRPKKRRLPRESR